MEVCRLPVLRLLLLQLAAGDPRNSADYLQEACRS